MACLCGYRLTNKITLVNLVLRVCTYILYYYFSKKTNRAVICRFLNYCWGSEGLIIHEINQLIELTIYPVNQVAKSFLFCRGRRVRRRRRSYFSVITGNCRATRWLNVRRTGVYQRVWYRSADCTGIQVVIVGRERERLFISLTLIIAERGAFTCVYGKLTGVFDTRGNSDWSELLSENFNYYWIALVKLFFSALG